ncbi:MAG: DUF1254 domain-containing protein [Pseudomonadota bacterium]
MIRIIALSTAAALAFVAGWSVMNHVIPKVIMVKAMEGLSARGDGVNTMTLRAKADPYNQFVVRPSPDLLYSTCVYDLELGPLEVTIGGTEGYLSVSFFDDLTNNYETIQDDDLGTELRRVMLTREDQETPTDDFTVISPSQRGLVLIRRQISGESALSRMTMAQADDGCQTMPL